MNFTRKAQFLSIFLFGIFSLQAQRPEVVFIEGNASLLNQRRPLGCPGQEAGTMMITAAQTNNSTNTQFLCYGDQLNILHNSDGQHPQDPNPLTTGGTGYVFYDCKPTVDGPKLSDVGRDPCVNKTTPIIVNGFPVNQLQGLWLVKTKNSLGDVDFLNDGFLQNTYNGGKPVQFWFAPITLDRYSDQPGVPQFESDATGVPGPCIDVNIDAAFSVVYLNEVEVTDINGVNDGSGNYTGSLTITGGLPEFDTTNNYPEVRIVHTQDPNIIGVLTNGPAKNGKTMTFSVPEPGRYYIEVVDGNGCPSERRTVNIPADDALMKIICQDGPIGQDICIPITLGKMSQLGAVQFSLNFNPLAFEYIGTQNLSPKLETTPENVVYDDEKAKGIIKFLWFDLSLIPRDFTMESTLVEFCFRAKGPPGNYDFRITGSPVALEVADISGGGHLTRPESGSILNCSSLVTPGPSLDAYFSQCGQTYFISIFGGKTPFSVKWEQEGNSGNTQISNVLVVGGRDTLFSNEPAGRYFISVTDSTGNNIKDTIIFNGGLAPLMLDLTTRENASCKNNDGRVAPRVLGGTPGYRYEWSNGSVDSLQTRLSVGRYGLTVTDREGCTITDSLVINQTLVNAGITLTPPTCMGLNNGTLRPNFSVITGIPPFSVLWEGQGTQVGNSFTGVGVSPYRLILTDFRGCADTADITPTPQKQINLTLGAENPLCFGNNDGRLTVIRSFSDGSDLTNEIVTLTRYSTGGIVNKSERPARFDNLVADRYNILVTDASGCIANLDTLLVQPPLFDTISVMITPESCFPGKDGRIEINMTGGTAPYQFIWDSAFANTNIITGLSNGNYRVTIRDANNCISNFDTSNVLLFPFVLPSVPVSIDTTAILCNGQGATLTARPGPGYTISTYTWSDGQTSAIAQNIKADTLTWLEVTDDKGCKGRDTVILSQPPALVWIDSITQLIDPQCFEGPGFDQGRILVQATGGTGPYNYTLSNGTSNNFGVFPGLIAGRYMVTVVDANNCPGLVLDTLLREPPRIVAVFDSAAFRNTRCATPGDCSGQARLLVSGGTDPLNNFLVQWESGEQTLGNIVSLADSLCSGQQLVRIFDGNGCRTQMTFNINAPEAISRDAARTTTQDITCFGYNDGTINYLALGGTSPFRYLWSDNDTTFNRTGLAAGRYNVTVTDLNSCMFTDSLTITQPPALLVTLDTIRTRPITCPGSNDGQLGISASGGNTGKITFAWTANFGDTNFVRNVIPGTYAVVATDVKGCTDTLSNILMDEPPLLTVAIQPSYSPTCAGIPVSITIPGVSGGNGASYTYTINNGTVTPIATMASLRAGNYQLTIFDRKGCALDTVFQVTDPPRFNIELGDDTRIRLGDSLRITVISNNPLNRVQWVNIDGLTCVTGDCSVVLLSPKKKTVFSATAYDGNDCVAFDNITLDVDLKRAVFIPNIFRPDQLSANQEFKLFANAGIAVIHSGKIFNRWGDLVSDVQNLAPDPGGVVIWDGRFRGTEALPGVYVYVIDVEFTDGERLIYKGDVTLLR